MNYPFLSLKDIDFAPQLAARVPAYLAYYHLAIPVAEEDDQITLWMVYPDNPKVVKLFQELLGQTVFPVRGSQNEIQQLLDQFYSSQSVPTSNQFLNGAGHPYVANLAAIFQSEVVDASRQSFKTLFKTIQQDPQIFSLVSVEGVNSKQARILLRDCPASLLLLRGQYPIPKRILIALQGHSPDLQAIQIALTIAGFHQADITLLGIAAPMKRHHVQGIATLLDHDTKAGQHVHNCLAAVQITGIEGSLKIRQGNPVEEIGQEFTEGNYDLMVIPVETYGDFVYRVLEKVKEYSPQSSNPIWAVRPVR